MELSIQVFLILVSIAFVGGIVSSISASPAIILLPSLMLVGLPTHSALGTQKLYNSVSLLTSCIYFSKCKLFCIKFWLITFIAAIMGSIIGVSLAHMLSSHIFLKLLPYIIATIALYLMFYSKIQHWLNSILKKAKPDSYFALILASTVGAYSGFVGPGTGPLWSLISTVFFKVPLKEANALACFFTLMTNVSALIIFIWLNEVNYVLGFMLSICGILGSMIGAKLILYKEEAFIQKILLIVTLIMAAALVFKDF